MAINAGDALAVLSLRPLIDNVGALGSRLALRILEEAERMARESVEGQALELWWRQHHVIDLGEADYLRMVLKKTCWYTTIYPMRVGALIGTRDGVELDGYLHFGFFVGAAFQIQDDLLNLMGDEASCRQGARWGHLGGQADADAHPSAQRDGAREARDRLSRVLGRSRVERTREEVQWVREQMDRHGSIDYARQVAHGLAGAAMYEFALAFADMPDSPDKDFLAALPTWVIERA